MPNSKKLATQRLIYLEGRFNKDSAFFEDYTHFMNNLLVRGHERGMDDSPVGRTWYIHHHSVYHSSKPKKIRIVLIAVLSLLECH